MELIKFPNDPEINNSKVRSFLRKAQDRIKGHYKRKYKKATIYSFDGILSFPGVYIIIQSAGANLKTYILFLYILQTSNIGEEDIPEQIVYSTFKTDISEQIIYQIILYLKKNGYIKKNKRDKTLNITSKGIELYKTLNKKLQGYYFNGYYTTTDIPALSYFRETLEDLL